MCSNDCKTAIFMIWNWVWTFKSLSINNCGLGLDMANAPENQSVGSVLLLDSRISNTPVGVRSAFTQNSQPETGGTLMLDNVDFSNCPTAVQGVNGNEILAGNRVVQSWGQGRQYRGLSGGQRVVGDLSPAPKPASLLGPSGGFFERSKPQYENYPASAFVSVKDRGARGDGRTDDTTAIQAVFDSVQDDQIVYFDHGAYIITSTVRVPPNIKITGEIWPMIMATGQFFSDQNNPKPVFQVGQPGQSGSVEMSDILFSTVGPAPGAILMEWNLGAASQGSNGLWDVHFRIGGFAGTQLQYDKCAKNPSVIAPPNPECQAAFLLLHVTAPGSVYVENCWFWVADHELDQGNGRAGQINIYNGRGVLLENNQGPVWLWGTSSEHNVLYQYQISNARDVFMGTIQTETPYYQSNPDATVPFTRQERFKDPDYSGCSGPTCRKSWGLRVLDSTDTLLYGGGLYSFFENYGQTCVDQNNCQDNMVEVAGTKDRVELYLLTTKAAVNMLTVDGQTVARDAENRNNFAATLLKWSP